MSASDQRCELRREGAGWVAVYDGDLVRLAPSKGTADLAVLLAAPRREVAAIDLARR